MHLVIQQSENYDFLPFSSDQYISFNISAELALAPDGILKITSEKDFSPHIICKRLENIDKKVSSILLIGDQILDWKFLVRLACHIRYHQFTNGLDKLPITLAFQSFPDLMFDKETLGSGEIENFQYEEGFYIKTWDDAFTVVKDEAGSTVNAYELFFQEQLSDKSFDAALLSIIKISPSHKQGSHAITNFWGAVNLARNAGYSITETGYEYPPTLYFKYLNKNYQSNAVNHSQREFLVKEALKKNLSSIRHSDLLVNDKIDLSKHPYFKNKRILLIDDNADKGWKSSIQHIFLNCTIDVKLDYEQVNQFGNTFNCNHYDLIFLDLRLPKIQSKSTTPISIYGFNLLSDLKKLYPHIPLIVFTASNKSWTMNEVLENGADGIYVKESPEYAADPQFSYDNFESFVNIVINCLEKYAILRPYWEMTRLIINDITFKSLPEKGQTQFKNRIIERLEMFYGLLKKGFEQHDYDKNRFHFLNYEMAFMTLWSTLNEISESNFIKSSPFVKIPAPNGKIIDKHPNGNFITYIPNQFYWCLFDSKDVFVQYEYFFKFETNGQLTTNKSGAFYKLNSKQLSTFVFEQNTFKQQPLTKTSVNYENTLFIQIAFILSKRLDLSTSPKLNFFLKDIVYLNEVRNKLYLTHGEQISAGFYDDLESTKRVSSNYNIKPHKDIKILFELITFLLTGKEVKLTF